MNTSQLKKFAQAARKKLIEQVAAKLEFVLHTDSAALREKADSLKQLQEAINTTSKAQVIDKVAYTWFNRLMALRFMDVNDYQPIGIRVVTPKDGYTLPEILEEVKHGHISDELHVNRNRLFELLDGKVPSPNPQNEVYKELLISACNHLNKTFPFLFERINDYTELLMPDDLISQYSIIQDVRDGMPAEDCQEVEIIGWLYQFYISEKKDEVFASKSSVKKEDIPAATQLFTPRWIVEYMVQNTVGKLWLQNRPASKIRQFMPYYIETASSTSTDYLKVNTIEELTLLDQACGSGHILVYGFELFYKIYEEEGYNPSDIPQLIIEKNLHGFEIDERASQLAGFALMMKARAYHRRFFKKEVKPNILCYSDLRLSEEDITDTFETASIQLSDTLKKDLTLMHQASNLGSLIQPSTSLDELSVTLTLMEQTSQSATLFNQDNLLSIQTAIAQLVQLAKKYHCVVDNPPYMGGGNMNKELGDFVKTNYPDSKADLMACFMEAGLSALHPKGFLGMINQHSWMFLSSYEKLRTKLIDSIQFDTLLHLGPRTFPEIGGEVVQNASFTFQKSTCTTKGSFIRLVDYDSSELKKDNTLEAIQNPQCGWFYTANQKDFEKIPGSPIGYWLSKKLFMTIEKAIPLSDLTNVGVGMQTGDNNQFIRTWQEITKRSFYCFGGDKWHALNKGGFFRKWYGNHESVILWGNNGEQIKNFKGSVIRNAQWYHKAVISWNMVSSGSFCTRYYPDKFVHNNASCFIADLNVEKINILGALMNSKLRILLLESLNPTLNFTPGDIGKFVISNRIDEFRHLKIINEAIEISKKDWDSRESSWDFQQNELIRCKSNCGQNCADLDMLDDEDHNEIIGMKDIPTNCDLLEDCYQAYKSEWKRKFFQLHRNEEDLNRQFIEIYGLQDELTPDVPLEDITILKEETSIVDGALVFHADEVFAQFVSYAVGCMFGRYSLDKDGLILANQGETLQDYLQKVSLNVDELAFVPDKDNIIPILDDEWFEDDVVGRFHAFLKASFGKENFDKNLAFVQESLGMDMRKYFTKQFYSDHIKRYKKRPIYWQFSSPKGSFNVLIYMHRYTPDTLNQILNGYLREYKDKISAHMEHLDHIIVTGSSSEATKATKQRDKYRQVLLELQEYERDILYPLATERIAIDLDDGVLVNYNKFGKAIKEVGGLNDKVTKKKVKEFDWINTEEIR
jgi:hypothetical protein